MKREEKFRKKPVIIEAFQFTNESKDAAYRWASSHQMNIYPSFDDYKAPILLIPTLEGEMICRIGDWIIRGVNGEFYPCKPDIFEKTYEPATSLPPAEGAEIIPDNSSLTYEEKMKLCSKEIAFIEQMYGIGLDEFETALTPLHYLSAMKDFAAQPQPTAEGAEEIRREYSEESLGFFRLFIKARKDLCAKSPTETYSLEEGIRKAFDGFFPKPLSIVDDAEKILRSHPYLKIWIENPGDSEMKVCNIEQAIWAIERVQRLADKKYADTEADGFVFCGKCGQMKGGQQ